MFEFTKAKRESVPLLISLAGQSGAGKSMSALRLAKGMSPSGKVFMIDTESRRGLLYADQFEFQHMELHGPFRPERFVEAVHAAEQAGAEVIIIDSLSHEYEEILDWATEQEASGIRSPGNFKVPKLAHKKMVSAFLQSRVSLIFCLRAVDKIEIAREGGKTQVRSLGLVPIAERHFQFEMTASFTLLPSNPGCPNFGLAHKLPEALRHIFKEGVPIDESAGFLLAGWARGGSSSQPEAPSLAQQGHACAKCGMAVLSDFWVSLTPAEKHSVGGAAQLESWKRVASEAVEREPGEEG